VAKTLRAESLTVPIPVAVPGGVSPDPPEPLTRLVGMYALTELPLESLLEVLHPEGADRVLLEAHVEGKRHEG
jgi:hypothetical protein